jgi:UDP-N-acetylglucosamine 2-epimerase (non-hydrolysing)
MTHGAPKKIVFVFGTRPEAIKLAPVIYELHRRTHQFQTRIWLTGQHRQMLDQVMDTFQLKADRDFRLMEPNQSLHRLTGRILEAMEQAFAQERPDCIVIQGDTTTVFAAALAAFYERIPAAHVEAGLRTYQRYSPFPEEINRMLASRLCSFHFAPTPRAKDNLLREGVPDETIWVTGNTVIDALDIILHRVKEQPPRLPEGFPLAQVQSGRRLILITGHRRENFGPGFEAICGAIARLARRYPEAVFVYPVHLNPNVRVPVHRMLGGLANVALTEPLEYEPFAWCMKHSHLILSDSGGIQEEAPHLGKPVLVMRAVTERPEAVEAGTARLVGTDAETIVRETARLMDEPGEYEKMSRAKNPFGDGQAARRIADALAEKL